MPWHSMLCVQAVTPNMFENSFQYTTHGINSHKSTQICFLNSYGKLLHVHVVQIQITVIKWLENHLNVLKRSNDP